MDTRPPRKGETRQHQPNDYVAAANADIPKRCLAQRSLGTGKQKNASGNHGSAIGPRLYTADLPLRTAGPERCRNPASQPDDPDQIDESVRSKTHAWPQLHPT